MHSSPSSITRVAWQGVPSSSIAVGPPLARHRAVVVGGHDRGGELVAQAAGVDRGAASAPRPTRARGRSPRGTALRRSRCRPRPASGPAGAGARVEHRQRPRAASSATAAGSPSNSSKPAWPASDSAPVSTRSSRRATTCVAEPHARAVVAGEHCPRSWRPGHAAGPRRSRHGDLAHLGADAARALVALAQQLGLALGRHRARVDPHVLARAGLRHERPRLGADRRARRPRPRRQAARGRARPARRRARSRWSRRRSTRIDAPSSEPRRACSTR